MWDITYKEYRDDGKENNSHPPCFSELLKVVLEMHGVFILSSLTDVFLYFEAE